MSCSQKKSNKHVLLQVVLESKWIFEPCVMKFPVNIPDVMFQLHEVMWPWPFHLQPQIYSVQSECLCLCQSGRVFIFLLDQQNYTKTTQPISMKICGGAELHLRKNPLHLCGFRSGTLFPTFFNKVFFNSLIYFFLNKEFVQIQINIWGSCGWGRGGGGDYFVQSHAGPVLKSLIKCFSGDQHGTAHFINLIS